MSSSSSRNKRVRCPHCDEYLSRSSYYQHKQLYFDEALQKWRDGRHADYDRESKRQKLSTNWVSFEFSPSCSPAGQDDAFEDTTAIDNSYCIDSDHEEVVDSEDEEFEPEVQESTGVELATECDTDNEEDHELECAQDANKRSIKVFLLFIFLWQSLYRVSDSAISFLLSFMGRFLQLLSRWLGLEPLARLAQAFPTTMHRAKKELGRLGDKFSRYVSCPKCHSIYKHNDCVIKSSTGVKSSDTCSFSRYPGHLQARMRERCGTTLLKTVRSSRGTEYLAAFKTFCYRSVLASLTNLLNREGNLELCEKWRTRDTDENTFRDVYDGAMWKQFQVDFLAEPFNYLLMLNCDWFQPFKHTQYSVGVMYLALENLPREVRFKKENVMIVGLIPGPTEPSKTINKYLQPLVEELKLLWEGVTLTINGRNRVVRAAVSCLACDVPAARKLGGFLAHNAKFGCNRCLKEFPRLFGQYPDYSGFVKENWEVRTHAVHVWYALKQKNANTREERETIEGMHGARYSLLYELPYYNAISTCVIDPMHCLFLGIAKRVVKVWKNEKILSDDDLIAVQAKVDQFCCPQDIGRIPYKLASKTSGLKADQWKNWTLYFSLYALKDVLPHRDYACWLVFVKLCRVICCREIKKSDLKEIDELAQNFCERFESLYGKKSLAPNLHLVAHLTDCIRDHGPVYAFWLYAFERMNGILGSFQTSNHDVTIQLIRKFITMQDVALDQWPDEIREEFATLFKSQFKEQGSLSETTRLVSGYTPLPPIREMAFDDEAINKIKPVIRSEIGGYSFKIGRLFQQCNAVAFTDNVKLAAEKSNYSHCSKVFVGDNLVEINFFALCNVHVCITGCEEKKVQYWLVNCTPYIEHQCRRWYGYPTQVWSNDLTSAGSKYCLIKDIQNRVVYVKASINFGRFIGEDNVLIVSPIPLT